MKQNIKTLLAAALVGSTAFVLHANTAASSSGASQAGQATSSEQLQQSPVTSQSSGSSGQKLLLDQLPKAVRQTMKQHADGSNLENIREFVRNGQQCYSATFDRADEKGKLTVAEDGSLLSLQESARFAAEVELPKLGKSDIALSELPQPVRQTIKLEAGPSQIGNLSRSEVNGQQLYRADFKREGIRHELFITPEGKIAAQVQETAFAIEPMQNVRQLALKDTPQAVQQAARSDAQGGKVSDVDKANWHGQTVYSVMIDKSGRLSQWIFDQNGKVIEEPDRQVNEAAGAENKSQQNKRIQSQPQQSENQSGSTQSQQGNQNQSPGQQSPK